MRNHNVLLPLTSAAGRRWHSMTGEMTGVNPALVAVPRAQKNSRAAKQELCWTDSLFKLQVWPKWENLKDFLLGSSPSGLSCGLVIPTWCPSPPRESLTLAFQTTLFVLCLGPNPRSQSNSCHVSFSSPCSLILFKVSMFLSSWVSHFWNEQKVWEGRDLSSAISLFLANCET